MAGEGKSEEQLKAVYFAAGVAAFMACIERAVVVSVFLHWRVWVFLVLNLLLLAILFTSKYKPQPKSVDQDGGTTTEVPEVKTSRECCSSPHVLSNVGEHVVTVQECGDPVRSKTNKNGEDDDDDDDKKEEDDLLSKEELNQRAEAFIAMFRQHLVLDAKE